MKRGARVPVVVDLGFGDAGKGLITDHLVRATGAEVVVRFNGGAQAGHNVVTAEGRHHTFAQFGAGTLAGARTLLSEHVLVHPTALVREAEVLRDKGVPDPLGRIRIHQDARLITPFHQAANRLRERARGEARHGSCGVGVGETVHDALAHPAEVVLASDLRSSSALSTKLRRIQERKRAELLSLAPPDRADPEWQILEQPQVIERWLEIATSLAVVVVDDGQFGRTLRESTGCVFEGAQGVLLDEDLGFHPFTTWSRCTDVNARAVIARHLPHAEPSTIGVLRSHANRHGPGPLPTETEALRHLVHEHNALNRWQGQVRYGWFDAVLARYALEAVGRVETLVLTHLDLLDRLPDWRLCVAYEVDGRRIDRLPMPSAPPLEGQARLTGLLQRATPKLAHATDFVELVEAQLGRAVDATSRGPRSGDLVFGARS